MTENTTQEQPMEQEQNLDGRTKRALDAAIAKKQVSQESYRAVVEGRIDLKTAKELGREGSPIGPARRPVDKDGVNATCLCGCGHTPASKKARWISGHDQRAVRWAKAVARGEDIQLTDEQRAYIEASGKLDRARAQVAKEEARKREGEAKRAEKK